jgi:glycosyltransferase involved in cell wall biosynthesis
MKKDKPLITTILPVYKEPFEFFTKAYQSIVGQNYPNLEIIIIIDNPQNNEAVNYFTKASKENEQTKLIINEKNLGLIRSLNKGLDISKGQYIARMDSDDVSLPKRFEKQLDYLINNSFDIVGGFAETIDLKSKKVGIWKMPTTSLGVKFLTRYHTPSLHPTWLCKAEVLKQVHGYREIKHAEDHDLLARALLSGHRVGNAPFPVIQYRINPESVSNKNSQWAYWGRVLIGRQFVSKTLEKLTEESFNNYIEKKLRTERVDPRQHYNLLIKSLLGFKPLLAAKSLISISKSPSSTLSRVKNKIIIKSILFLDKIASLVP